MRLDKASKNSTIFSILSPLSDMIIEVIPDILPRLKQKVRTYRQLKKIKPFINGNDLKKLGFEPERQFKVMLKKLHDWQFDRKISSIKEAAVESNDLIKTIGDQLKDTNSRGINTPQTSRLFELAKAAASRGDYETALERSIEN